MTVLKCLLIAVIVIALAIPLGLYLLGRVSQNQPPRTLSSGTLAPCPHTPNCVCSEYPQDTGHFIDAIELSSEPQLDDLEAVVPIIEQMGGVVVARTPAYLSATFKSALFGFVDDFELRLDAADNTLHLRAASRVGRSDLGVNASRAMRFKEEFRRRF